MINGLGVLGWGVGGIEAEAAMLGQPVSMLIPRVVGFRLRGRPSRGRHRHRSRAPRDGDAPRAWCRRQARRVSRTGLGRAVPRRSGDPRQHGPRVRRYTVGLFPVDSETIAYLRFTGRDPHTADLAEAYMRAQGLFHTGTVRSPRTARLSISTRRGGSRARRAQAPPGPRAPGQRQEGLRRVPRWDSRRDGPRRSRAERRRADAGGPRGLRASPRLGGHRRDHLVHEHLEPGSDARCRASWRRKRLLVVCESSRPGSRRVSRPARKVVIGLSS